MRNRVFRHQLGALLRKNVLGALLAQPAAQALTGATGEAISRLRDDLATIANFLYMTTFLVGNLLFAAIALVVMVNINGVAAARMLVREPELLVFDDLSSALDVETEALLWDRLLLHKEDRTILAVSHRPVALHHADQLIKIEKGCRI